MSSHDDEGREGLFSMDGLTDAIDAAAERLEGTRDYQDGKRALDAEDDSVPNEEKGLSPFEVTRMRMNAALLRSKLFSVIKDKEDLLKRAEFALKTLSDTGCLDRPVTVMRIFANLSNGINQQRPGDVVIRRTSDLRDNLPELIGHALVDFGMWSIKALYRNWESQDVSDADSLLKKNTLCLNEEQAALLRNGEFTFRMLLEENPQGLLRNSYPDYMLGT